MMKLSIEEKAKAYDESIERAKVFKKHLLEISEKDYADEIDYIFPELKENRDEKVKKSINRLIRYYHDVNFPTPEGFSRKDLLDWIEKQCEQKPADKIEPKFKVGDWVTMDGCNYNIDEVLKSCYNLSNVSGNHRMLPHFAIDDYYRLWTIQDAKAGDVLHSTGRHNDCIFIFNGLDNWIFDEPNGDRAVATGYCCLFVSADKMEFGIQGPDCIEVNTIKPATKIQRDLLFQKMKEAGYEWDAEKKELKKIEQKHTEWSVEDEERYESCLQKLGTGNPEQPETINSKWFKEHVYPKPQWKTDSSMLICLEYAIKHINKDGDKRILSKLLEQLKQL